MLQIALSTALLGAIFFIVPNFNPAYAAAIQWTTSQVSLNASDFSITTNGKTFTGNNVQLHSDPGTPVYTTLEATWNEQGVEMRLYMYFTVENGQWKVDEIRTYNGQPSGDWLFYNGFTGGQLGNTYTGSMDINSNSGPGTGTIHFSDLHLLPNFVTQDYAIQVTSPNGGEHFTQGQSTDIHWNFKNPGRTDTQTFNTSIYVQKNDGTRVLTLVENQSITKFNDNAYHWNITNLPTGEYRINVYLNTPFATANGTQNLNDVSDGTFTVDSGTIVTPQDTATPTTLQTPPTMPFIPTEANTQTNNSHPTPTSIWLYQGKNSNKSTKEKDANNTKKKVLSDIKKQPIKQNNFFSQIVAWFHVHFHFFS